MTVTNPVAVAFQKTIGGQVAVSETDPLPTTATLSGDINADAEGIATAAAPSYVEGSEAALSLNLTGDLRTVTKIASDYPAGAIPITASATGTTGATTATLAAHATRSTYIAGFSIRAVATAAVVGNATVTGTITGTLNYTQFTAPAATAIGIVEQTFNPPIPSSAANTAIAVISAAPGTGGVVSVTAWGYQL